MTVFEKALDYAKAYIESLDPMDSAFVEAPGRIISQVEDEWYLDLWDSVIDGFSQVYGDRELDKLTEKELKKLKAFIYLYALKYHYPNKVRNLIQELVDAIRVSQ